MTADRLIAHRLNINSKQHVRGACGSWAHADNNEQQGLVGIYVLLTAVLLLSLSESH